MNGERTHTARLQPPPPDQLPPGQAVFRRRLLDGPRGRRGDVPLTDERGALAGPFAVMAVAPGVGDAVQNLGATLRYTAGLDPLLREAAVLLVAAHHDSAFEWYAHEPAARRLGLGDGELALLRAGKPPRCVSPAHRSALHAVSVMLRTGHLDDDTYAGTVAALGERALAELVWLTGYYTMLALALNVFDPPGPPAPPGASGQGPAAP